MDARLDELEVRYTYLERTVRELDEVVLALRSEVDKLRREVRDVHTSLHSDPHETPPNEKPPHY